MEKVLSKKRYSMFVKTISLKRILLEIDEDIWKKNFHIELSEKLNTNLIR